MGSSAVPNLESRRRSKGSLKRSPDEGGLAKEAESRGEGGATAVVAVVGR